MSNNEQINTYKKEICEMIEQLSDISIVLKIYRFVYFFWKKSR